MTIESAELADQPGRAHNLTPDQEQKLKDMWAFVLNFTGLAPDNVLKSVSSLSSHVEEQPAKKKGFFRRGSATPNAPEKVDLKSINGIMEKHFEGLTKDQVIESLRLMINADHPDNLLLRFLRARKWDVGKAINMMSETLAWRVKEGKVTELLMTGESGAIANNDDGFMLQLRSGKAFVWGHDFKGRPLAHIKPHLHDPKAQTEKDIENFTISFIETVRICLNDTVDTAAVVFDLSKFSMANMDYAAVKFIIKCFEGHYPESLGFLLIHKAPWIFQGIWNVIKGWIDPVVASKISFTRSYEDMAKLIPAEYIQKENGGTAEWEYKYIEPQPGEDAKIKDVETRNKLIQKRIEASIEFERACEEWINATDRKANAEAVEKKNKAAQVLRDTYWESDSYVRARTISDRNGVVKSFHPEDEK